MRAELAAQPAVALAALLHHLVPKALPGHFGHTSSRDFLALTGKNNHDGLLLAADDLDTSPAWSAIEMQRARWIAELPAKRADLLPSLIQQDPGTTLLDLLAFCTGTLLDGITDEERPHAINALAGALNLDMTGYWTPTRATYFDHVSKARIAEVVAVAVSPKAAADLDRMKKADAAAAAELRLAKVAWVPEIFTDREIPAAPSWESRDDDEDEDEDGSDGTDTGADAEETPEDEDADTEPGAAHATEHANDTPPDAPDAPAAVTPQSAWALPTADSVSTGQSGPLAS